MRFSSILACLLVLCVACKQEHPTQQPKQAIKVIEPKEKTKQVQDIETTAISALKPKTKEVVEKAEEAEDTEDISLENAPRQDLKIIESVYQYFFTHGIKNTEFTIAYKAGTLFIRGPSTEERMRDLSSKLIEATGIKRIKWANAPLDPDDLRRMREENEDYERRKMEHEEHDGPHMGPDDEVDKRAPRRPAYLYGR